ncbi:MAG TPA: hypothetical protein VNZ64_23075 [Candidatus Acidoferrum sp.]|jgi:hypothetical protein|nr:hypothetical protein [Candidatus Acidoferrum sp.]
MDFEVLIKEMESVMMPELQRRADALRDDKRFTDVRVVSRRHAQVIHTIGLSCHPVAALSSSDQYSIGINIMGHGGLSMRGFVTWSEPYQSAPVKTAAGKVSGRRNLGGYTIQEGVTRPFDFQPGETVEDFVRLLPTLYDAFDRGVERGHPPGAFRKLWNRAS